MRQRTVDHAKLQAALDDRPEVLFAYLFGSAASGITHGRSDVDVAVYISAASITGSDANKMLHDLWIGIYGELVRILGRDDVDLVILNRTSPLLAERVARYGQLMFSRDEVCRIRWIVETKSRYCDLKPVRSRLDRVVAERIRSGRFGHAHG